VDRSAHKIFEKLIMWNHFISPGFNSPRECVQNQIPVKTKCQKISDNTAGQISAHVKMWFISSLQNLIPTKLNDTSVCRMNLQRLISICPASLTVFPCAGFHIFFRTQVFSLCPHEPPKSLANQTSLTLYSIYTPLLLGQTV
jgi:hypothetical protein